MGRHCYLKLLRLPGLFLFDDVGHLVEDGEHKRVKFILYLRHTGGVDLSQLVTQIVFFYENEYICYLKCTK